MLFDEPYYLAINEARWRAAEAILDRAGGLSLSTCLDLGAGPGWFSARLAGRGLRVIGVEGRDLLVDVARRSAPQASFVAVDIERIDESSQLKPADLVFCFGLLYHLENPFSFARTLYRLTGKLLLLETQLVPGDKPIALLVEEGRNETQGLTHCSLIPTKACLLKMLERAGFSHIYEWQVPVDHADFVETPERYRRRSIFAVSHTELTVEGLARVQASPAPKFNYQKTKETGPRPG